MKVCTKVRVTAAGGVLLAGKVKLIDWSLVSDDHQFGVDEDGYLHIEGHLWSAPIAGREDG